MWWPTRVVSRNLIPTFKPQGTDTARNWAFVQLRDGPAAEMMKVAVFGTSREFCDEYSLAFTEGFDTADLKEAKALLKDLS